MPVSKAMRRQLSDSGATLIVPPPKDLTFTLIAPISVSMVTLCLSATWRSTGRERIPTVMATLGYPTHRYLFPGILSYDHQFMD